MASNSWEDDDDIDGDRSRQGDDYCVEEESLASLEAKLAEYQKSLQDVEAALEISPDEPELEKLFKDLQELVSLYKDLVEIRSTREPKRRRLNAQQDATASALGSDSSFRPHSEGVATTDLSATGHQALATQKQPTLLDYQGAVPIVDRITNLKSLLNHACYSYYEGALYLGRVISIVQSTGEAGKTVDEEKTAPPKVVVEYIGWGNRESLSVDEIRLLPSVNNLTAGASCWAVNQTDGLWYLATVTRPDKEKGIYHVRFRDSNESVTIANDQVSIKTPFACIGNIPTTSQTNTTKESSQHKRSSREVVTPGGYRIPEKLTIKPEDSDKVKQLKKKKVSLIKKEQRKELIEQDARLRQSTWKNHAASTGKKLKTKQSIFRTTENQQSKVGVTGSGQKMTRYATRSRHDYDETEDDQ